MSQMGFFQFKIRLRKRTYIEIQEGDIEKVKRIGQVENMGAQCKKKHFEFPEKLKYPAQFGYGFGDQERCQQDVILSSFSGLTEEVNCQKKALKHDDGMQDMFDVSQYSHGILQILGFYSACFVIHTINVKNFF